MRFGTNNCNFYQKYININSTINLKFVVKKQSLILPNYIIFATMKNISIHINTLSWINKSTPSPEVRILLA